MANEWIRWLAEQPEEERQKAIRALPDYTRGRVDAELEAIAQQRATRAAEPVEVDDEDEGPDYAQLAPAKHYRRNAVMFVAIVGVLGLLTFGLTTPHGQAARMAPAASASTQSHTSAPTQPDNAPPAHAATSAAYSWAQIDAKATRDVGLVSGCNKSFFGLACSGALSGTAWIVDAGQTRNTLLVTANHVVAEDQPGTITVHLPGVGVKPAKVIAHDKAHDVAMLEIEGLPQSGGLDPAGAFPSCGSDAATVDQQVAEIGYPRGDYQQAMTTGTVTGVNVHQFVLGLGIMTEDAYDAANIPGESGSPVFNQQGCVIGIADAVTATNANNGDFLPITYIHSIGVNW